MDNKSKIHQFVLCVKNDQYPASLEVRKVYRLIPDAAAEAKQFLRVVDESQKDYLYPASYFVAIELPKAAVSALGKAS